MNLLSFMKSSVHFQAIVIPDPNDRRSLYHHTNLPTIVSFTSVHAVHDVTSTTLSECVDLTHNLCTIQLSD